MADLFKEALVLVGYLLMAAGAFSTLLFFDGRPAIEKAGGIAFLAVGGAIVFTAKEVVAFEDKDDDPWDQAEHDAKW